MMRLSSRAGFFMGLLLGIGGVCRSLGPVWAGFGWDIKNFMDAVDLCFSGSLRCVFS